MKSKTSKPPATKRSSHPCARALPDNDLRCVYPEKQIQKRVRELAKQIDRDYKGKTLHVVGILEDCFIFMADLVRSLTIPVVCHFTKAEIHDTSAGPTAVREIMYTPKVEAAGRDVLLVDGILQSGLTLDHLYSYVLGQNPSSVRTASLIEKSGERTVDVSTDYVGFKSNAKFLVGYGLGYQEKYRNLPFVARLVRAG
ncbi:MAG: hypoxanthine phosphoribosyltransferase [Terriglobia bacterium]|jgi:hypoxanthine phosphoribosyltransferase